MKHINILIAFAALAVACNPEVVVTELPVKSIAIVQGDQTLTVGETVVLAATVDPESSIVDWTSSDEAVVRVASSGKAVALSAGRSVITAAARDKSASITITVTEPASEPALSVTGTAEKVTAVSAALGGKANVESMAGVVVGVQYSLYPGMLTNNSTVVEVKNAENSFSASVTGLEPNSTYYYRSVLIQGGLTYVGETKEFKTKELSTLISTDVASGVEKKCATLLARLDLKDVEYETVSYGFCWGLSEDQLTNDVVGGSVASGVFSVALSDLGKGTTYWYMSYVVLDGKKYCGDVVSFKTLGVYVFQEPVDLGLSVKWASCNLGAEVPEGYGDYYAWGELEPYYSSLDPLEWKEGKDKGYNWPSYRWFVPDPVQITKYNTMAVLGEVDNKLELDPEDDVAQVLLEDGWRMPTSAECEELCNECTWTLEKLNGVDGFRVSGNGNSIFLPFAGVFMSTNCIAEGEQGLIWLSSLIPDQSTAAYMLAFYTNDSIGEYYIVSGERDAGFSIRPVLSE